MKMSGTLLIVMTILAFTTAGISEMVVIRALSYIFGAIFILSVIAYLDLSDRKEKITNGKKTSKEIEKLELEIEILKKQLKQKS
ncbi:MAG: hypothetical protein V3V92_05530 [Candidatus Hydrothermarchaeales archaeon]